MRDIRGLVAQLCERMVKVIVLYHVFIHIMFRLMHPFCFISAALVGFLLAQTLSIQHSSGKKKKMKTYFIIISTLHCLFVLLFNDPVNSYHVLLYSKPGVCRGIPIFLIFAPKHRL